MTGRLFVFGLGFSGLEIAKLARAGGWTVAGTCRTREKIADLAKHDIEAHLFDGTATLPAEAVGKASHIISTIPPGPEGDRVLAASARRLRDARWLGYLSTTGVYGDQGGDWIDEDTPPRPLQPRSMARLVAERAWLAMGIEAATAVDIFRLPGIYGPGRSAIDRVRAGTARRIDKPGHVFSRVHVADIAGTVLMAITRSRAGAIYNVADDLPATPADVTAFACELLGEPVPPAIPWEQAASAMGDMARSFYAESRRVRNERIKRELGVVLRYPTYREGLRAIASSSGTAGLKARS